MFDLGPGPGLMLTLGYSPEVVDLFSVRELSVMQLMLNQTNQEAFEDRFEGLNNAINTLRLQDSVNRKLLLLASMRLQDGLDDVASNFDSLYPEDAPHAVILGPSFPRDVRDTPVHGKILVISGQKVTDHQGVFGDPFWETVGADERLAGRILRAKTGTAAGQDFQITDHILVGAGAPYIVLEDVTDLTAGDEFEIEGVGLPQEDLGKNKKSGDWAITTRINGVFNGASPATSTIFADTYWLRGGNPIPGRLKGRTITVLEGAAAGTYEITSHNVGAGSIEMAGSPAIAGTEAFWIAPRSPADTGKQRRGSLRVGDPSISGRWDTLEPGTRRRMVAATKERAGELASILEGSMEQIERYIDLRFHRFFGSYRHLRRFRKIARLERRRWEQEQARRRDIEQAALELNLPLVLVSEEDDEDET